MSDSLVKVERALVSVYDKTGLMEFCSALSASGVELVSSGGTARALRDAGLPVTPVADVTGHPEILGGRVKTLHPAIHGGILADLGDPRHQADLEANNIAPFQLVVSNLYPFRQAAARRDLSEAEVIEEIDIGGPAMVRAAAKNHAWVGIVTDPDQYERVLSELGQHLGLTSGLRRQLARMAFFHTAAYDAAIVDWIADLMSEGDLPHFMVVPLQREANLRYGENPHQSAAVYRSPNRPSWWEHAEIVQGKEMSFNNYVDADAAWSHVHAYDEPACVIVKHTNACGVSVGGDLPDVFRRAWDCDPVSAFGSVIAVNRPLDDATADAMLSAGFIEVVIAPSVEDRDALAKRKNLRVIVAPPPLRPGVELRGSDGGFLAQRWDSVGDESQWKVVTSRKPTDAEWTNLRFAWRVGANTKSNAIVVAKNLSAVGIGAGDQSRVGATQRALNQAGLRASGGVAASDAFFPFRDGPDALAEAGITAIIQPGGSIRDEEVIAAAEEHAMAMVLTGRRHFLH